MARFFSTLTLPALSGALLILAYPDFHLYLLSFIYLAPLFYSLKGVSYKRAAFSGTITGTVAFAGIFHWVTYTMMMMSDFPLMLALLALFLFSVASGGIYALFSAGTALILRRFYHLRYLLVPTLFVLLEYIYPMLFPAHLGNTFTRVLPLIQISDITGIYGLSFLAVAGNLLFYESVIAIREKFFWRRGSLKKILIYSLCLVLTVCYGYWRLADIESTEVDRKLNVLIHQPNVTLAEKKNMTTKLRREIYDRLEKAIVQNIRDDHDLVVLPEGGFPFLFVPEDSFKKGLADPIAYTKKLFDLSKKISKPLITGAIRVPFEKARNSAVLVEPDGKYFIYDKMKLLAFGEYMPFSDIFPFLKGMIKRVSDMEEGEGYGSVVVKDMKIFFSICYEAIFPSFTRKGLQETGADMIVNLTNDGWFGPDEAPEQHLIAQAQRTVELRLPLLRVTNTGISALIDQSGRIRDRTKLDTGETKTIEVRAKEIGSFYRDYGDLFILFIFLASLTSVFVTKRHNY